MSRGGAAQTAVPRIVLVVDPRRGAQSPEHLTLADGTSLLETVADRSVREAGHVEGTTAGGAELGAWLSRELTDATLPGREPAPLCLVDGAALARPTTYGDLVADPRPGDAVLRDASGNRVIGVRVDNPAAAGAGLGSLVARALAGAPPGGSLTVLAGVLQASGGGVREASSGAFPVAEPGDPAATLAAERADEDVDEAALRLLRSSRADDGFLSTFLVRPLSRRVTARAVRRGVRPATVTVVALALGLVAAAAYGGGSLGWRLAGSALLFASLVVDCVDGEVARYTRTMSPRGGWMDIGADRAKDFAVLAGLAAGAGTPAAWELAAATFAVLVWRHVADLGFAAGQTSAAAGGDPVADWSARTNAVPALQWLKRLVIMPVGERTIVLVVLAPAVGATWALRVLLALAVVAAAYMTAGRLGRRLLRRGASTPTPLADPRLRAMADLGPLAARLPRLDGRLGWLLPALLRAVECGGLLWLAAAREHSGRLLPATYALLVATALHQYDVVYRQRLAGAVADDGWLGRPGLVPRVAVVAILLLAVPARTAAPILWALAGIAAIGLVADSARFWRDPAYAPPPWPRWLPGQPTQPQPTQPESERP